MRGNSFRKINEKSWCFYGKSPHSQICNQTTEIFRYFRIASWYLVAKIIGSLENLENRFNQKNLVISLNRLLQLDFDIHANRLVKMSSRWQKKTNFNVSCYKITDIKPSAVSFSLYNRFSISFLHFMAHNISVILLP